MNVFNRNKSKDKKIKEIVKLIQDAEAIVIGAGAGMSTAAGFTYGGERFEKLFPEELIFATQGDYGYFQCEDACHKKLYNNEAEVREMISNQKDCRIPSELVSKCPVCGGDMEVNLRCDERFVEDENWHIAYGKYESFIKTNQDKKIVFIDLGTGMNTPGIIKYPFWSMTNGFLNAHYVCINLNEAYVPNEIKDKSICIDDDIKLVLEEVKNMEM